MLKERVFPVKVAPNGESALKEQLNKHMTGNNSRSRVLYALTSEFRLVTPVLYHKGGFVNLEFLAYEEGVTGEQFFKLLKERNQAFYYPLANLTYLCQHSFVEEDQKVVRNSLKLYVPKDLKTAEEGGVEGLICTDITTALPYRLRTTLAEQFLEQARSRL